MHELSIAVSLVEVATAELERLGDVRVQALHLRLGPMAGVVKEALCFCFEVAAAGTPLADARLDIRDVQPAVWCPRCEDERPVVSISQRVCASCGAVAPRLVRGDELELVGLEINDP